MLLRISLIVAILAGLATIVVTHLKTREHVQQIITARNDFEDKMKQQTARANTAEKTLASTRETLGTTSNTLVKTEQELTGTKQQLAMVQENLNKTRAELAKANEERGAALADLEKWRQTGQTPEQVVQTVANLRKAEDAITALNDEKRILSRQVTQLKNRLAQLIQDDYVVELPPGTKGNVVAVDPKWNFVIVDLGAEKGMLEGGVLMVHRNSQLVGKVRIREVMQNRSVANMMPGWKLGDIEEGDQVIY